MASMGQGRGDAPAPSVRASEQSPTAGWGARAAARGVELARDRLQGLGQGELRELLGALLPPGASEAVRGTLERAARALGRGRAARPAPRVGAGGDGRAGDRRVTRPPQVRRRAPAPSPAGTDRGRPPRVDPPAATVGPPAATVEPPAASVDPPAAMVEAASASVETPAGPVEEPAATGAPASVFTADPHEVASAWLGRSTWYQAGATASDWRRGRFDCSGFLLHALEQSGIDIGARVPFDLPRAASGPGASEQAEATTYDLVHMTEEVLPELGRAREEAGDVEVEAILRRHGVPRRGGIDARVAALPDGRDKTRALSLRRRAERARAERLRQLVEADDPRTWGVVHAMAAAGFGRPVEPEAIRPGDMVQTWTFGSVGVTGHAGVAHVVRCRGDLRDARGAVLHDVDLVLDRRTDPADVLAITEVRSVELLGAHAAGSDQAGRRRPGGVYVKPPARFVPGRGSGFDRVHVGRPASSPWP